MRGWKTGCDSGPGELLWFGPPGNTGLRRDPTRTNDLLLVAGGTGLAPLRALVEQVAAWVPTAVKLLFSNWSAVADPLHQQFARVSGDVG
ncbi:hypothetical protein [Micromonospora sp. NPDC005206]|uniref:hypothetical protein n=1 Tax=Micromonospora sp. NPDC005206 TaxID=3157022 RepID=UPI0033B8D662